MMLGVNFFYRSPALYISLLAKATENATAATKKKNSDSSNIYIDTIAYRPI